MIKNFTYRLFLLLLMLCFVGAVATLSAYDEQENYAEEELQDYSQDSQGDAEVYDQQDAGEAYDEETSAPVDAQYSDQEQENYVEETYIEQEAQVNEQAPVWEGPIPFEPAYSGKENMRIERSTRPKRNQGMTESVEQQRQKDKTDEQQQDSFVQRECNPVVRVSANQEKPFDVLKALADEHGFEIMMLEAENQPISLEKNEVLSRVIESITRDMSVVLNYQKEGACERLVAISVLDNSEWSGVASSRFGSPDNSSANANVRQYKPGNSSFSSSRGRPENTYNSRSASEQRQSKMEKFQQLREERRKARKLREQNEESLNEEYSDNDAYETDRSRDKIEQIENMEVYVDEVMSGKRVPNIRGMTTQQRTEYMRLRRENKKQN